ncbi:MAG: Quaternary ammonium compound-resistance protein SugE [Pseudomonas sp.]|nr:MAG: Quaternary ammonium compound-resistance protein SugE [Pseudomonas sp.]
MSWIILFFAGLAEVGWAVGLKYTDGFSKPLPTALTIAAMAVSLGLLGLAMKELPLGTAYAIWTGVGAVGTVIAGIILFGESMALFLLASVGLIIAGLIGLKISARATALSRASPLPHWNAFQNVGAGLPAMPPT